MGIKNFTKHALTWIIIVFFISVGKIHGQPERIQHWYLGNSVQIDFSGNTAESVTRSSTTNGYATISDEQGNLLFYKGDSAVYNASNQIVENSKGITGRHAELIPQPGNDSIIYLLTSEDATLKYSIININRNSGNGEVTTRNIHLNDSNEVYPETLTSIQHGNTQDYWILTYGERTYSDDTLYDPSPNVNKNFLAYKLTSNGIQQNAVLSTIDTTTTNRLAPTSPPSIIDTKPSPDGSTLAMLFGDGSISPHVTGLSFNFKLYKINPSTGKVTYDQEVNSSGNASTGGLCFSPDNSKLYFFESGRSSGRYSSDYENALLQYDLNADSIERSETIIDSVLAPYSGWEEMQIGIDCKIYLTNTQHNYLGVINNPNEKGRACNFQEDGLYLDSANGVSGNISYPYSWLPYSCKPSYPPTTGISPSENSSNIVLYPNPVKNQLNIKLNVEDAGQKSLFVTDFKGKKVIQKTVSLKQGKNLVRIYTGDLKNAPYLLTIGKGEQKTVKRFIKK